MATKDEIRTKYLAYRNSLQSSFVQEASKVIFMHTKQILSLQKPHHVLVYIAVRNEVATKSLINWLLERNICVSVPAFFEDEEEYKPVVFTGWEHLKTIRTYPPQPTQLNLADLSTIEVAMIPGVAFDKEGNRLGFGGGNYDRLLATLSQNCLKIGLAYAGQIIENVPKYQHDVHMDIVITEKEVVKMKVEIPRVQT